MPELAEAFISLRVHSTEVAKDVNRGLREGAARGSTEAGAVAGTGFGAGFRAKAGPVFRKTVNDILKGGAASLGIIGVASLKMAAEFQTGLTSLVTGAGESEANLKLVSAGIKNIAVSTGTTTSQLISGMFMIESAGYHGAAGLDVLKAAAEGAKVGNADLGAVANAVTTVMTDYALKGPGAAAAATNALIATTARGKTHLQDLATSMARVLPTAAALHIGMGQVGGAMATMTGEGTSARLAAMGLNATILAMAAPTHAASKTMGVLGLSSKSVAETLTKHGLIAALQQVSAAARKAGPEGSPAYVAAMKSMLGGTNGLRVGLQLTGTHMSTLVGNTAAVSAAMGKGKGAVLGWSLVQKDFNQQLDVLRARAEVAAINIGTRLMPIVSTLIGLFAGHTTDVLIFAGAVLGIAVVAKTVMLAMKAWEIATVVWAAVTNTSLVTTIALWVMYTLGVESAGVATVIATGGIILVVAGLIAAGYELYKHWGTVWKFVKGIVMDAWKWIKQNWPLLGAVLLGPVAIAAVLIYQHVKVVRDAVRGAFSAIAAAARIAWLVVSTAAKIAWDLISGLALLWWAINKPILVAFRDLVTFIFSKVVVPVARVAWALVTGYVRLWWAITRPVLQAFSDLFTLTWHAMLSLAGTVWTRGIVPLVQSAISLLKLAIHGVWDVISAVFGWILNGAAKAFGWIPGLGPKLKDAARTFSTFRDQVNAALNGVKGRTVNVDVALALGGSGHGQKTKALAAGGQVRGPGGPKGDRIPALLSDSEYVVQAASVARYGVAMMDAINAGRYAGGGLAVRAHAPSRAQIDAATWAGMQAFVQGAGLGAALGALGGGGAGVQQWAGIVALALSMLGLPAAYRGFVLDQMQSESGGNSRAINLTDVNAQRGDPSRGLMQTTMATFLRWAGAFVSRGIYDPFANVYAALNYGEHGRGFGTGPGQIGSMHGYRLGGRIPEDVLGIGASGKGYLFHGGENVTPAGGAPAAVDTGLEGHLSAIIGAVEGLSSVLAGQGARAGVAAQRGALQAYYGV